MRRIFGILDSFVGLIVIGLLLAGLIWVFGVGLGAGGQTQVAQQPYPPPQTVTPAPSIVATNSLSPSSFPTVPPQPSIEVTPPPEPTILFPPPTPEPSTPEPELTQPPEVIPTPSESGRFTVVEEIRLGEEGFFSNWAPSSDNILLYRPNGQTIPVPGTNTTLLLADFWKVPFDGIAGPELLVENVNGVEWSPDGSQILFRRIFGPQNVEFYIADADGTGAMKIATGEWGPFAWLASGDIVYVKNGIPHRKDPVTGRAKPAPPLDVRVEFEPGAPRKDFLFSPNGEYIAYANGSSLWLMNSDGNERILISHNFTHNMAWSPDSGQLAYTVHSGPPRYDPEIWIVSNDGSQSRRIVKGRSNSGFVSISWFPDGQTILFVHDVRPSQIFITNVDGTGLTRLILNGWNPKLSPDGHKIAFQRLGQNIRVDGELWIALLAPVQ